MSQPAVLTLMFHRVDAPALGCQPEQFATYLNYLTQHFPIVLPGETLHHPLSICLTFDDAYYDFYHYVYPLLKKHQIKALLAVPVKYIIEKTTVDPAIRLSLPSYEFMEARYQDQAPLCTWEELQEMHQSGHVSMACHSYSHANMADPATDIHQEAFCAQQILSEKLNTPIEHFVYPYGKMTVPVHKKIGAHYRFGIRIGTAINLGWDNQRQYIYRINADPLWTTLQPINKALIRKLTFKYWLNRFRGK